MHVNIIQPLACVIVFLMDAGLLSTISAGCGQLVKMLLNHMVYLDQILHTYLF